MPKIDALSEKLAQLADAGLLRVPDDGETRRAWEREYASDGVDGSSNDYLGLARLTVSRETPAPAEGDLVPAQTPRALSVSRETSAWAAGGDAEEPLGAGASRLVHGTYPVHLEVERLAARWVGAEAGLLFASGYAANVGALSALLEPGDVVVSDSLNHASLIDGIRLSRARAIITPHLDLAAIERALQSEKVSWVVVESYYSMDGDGPDLRRLRELCDRYGANLYVDEAHSIGLFGPGGAGLCAAAGIRPEVLVAAFGKAVGSQGAVVAGAAELRTWLYNRARSFVYSTAPTPAHSRQLLLQLGRAMAADEPRLRVQALSLELRERLKGQGIELGQGTFGPILGVVIGEEARAVAVAKTLASRGVLAQAIRPPTVPVGEARIRLTVGARWRTGDPELVANEVRGALALVDAIR